MPFAINTTVKFLNFWQLLCFLIRHRRLGYICIISSSIIVLGMRRGSILRPGINGFFLGRAPFSLPPGGKKMNKSEFTSFLRLMRRTYNRKTYKACIQMLQPCAPFAASQRVRQLQICHSVRYDARYHHMSCTCN